MDNAIKAKFDSYPKGIQAKMRRLRQLILDVAAADQRIGKIDETLKWGEPAFLTRDSKSGTTIRIDWKTKSPDQYALYVNCNTTLIDTYRSLFPELSFEGNRAIIIHKNNRISENTIRTCIHLALTYHLNKKAKMGN